MAGRLAKAAFYLGWIILLVAVGLALFILLSALMSPCESEECKPGLSLVLGGTYAGIGFVLWRLLILPYEVQRRKRRKAESTTRTTP